MKNEKPTYGELENKIFQLQKEIFELKLKQDISVEKLKESEERLSLFFAQSLDGFFFMMLDEPVEWNDSIDKDKALDYVFEHQRITKANSAMLEQYGATEEKYLGLTPNDLFEHDIKHGRQVWKDFFNEGQLHIDTHEMKFDGTDMIIEGDYLCLFDSQKRITGHFGIQKDVTTLRHAEEILQKSKNQLQEYWDSDISADYISSIDGEILNCNPTFLKLFGIEEKLTSDKIDFIKFYKNLDDRSELIRKVSENGRVENYEIDFIKHDGKVINSIINAIGIFDDAKKMIGIRGYIIDITDRKNAEETLRKSEEKYRLLFSENPQPMWIYDLETLAFIEVNQAAIKHYGYSRQEFLSMTLKDIHPAEDIPALMNNIEQISNNLNFSGEWRHIKKNREIISVEITSHAVLSNNRHARHVMINDITKRKQTESEILKLSHAVEQSPVSIIITDTDGNIENGNQKVLETTGYTAEELIGKNPRIFNSGEKPKSDYQNLWGTISSGREWFGEFHNKKKNGELYWEQASISSIKNVKGEITHYVAVKEDISEKKKNIEDLIVAKEKAQESDRLKSAFLANMSHEIRTPMNGILGFANLLKEPELSGEEQQKYINIIEKSGERMLTIINNIISISKIESGIMNVHLSEMNVNNQMEFVYNTLKLDAEKNNLTLSYSNTLPDNEAFIKTDGEKFYSILTNLVKNSIKYTKTGSIEFGYHLKTVNKYEKLEFFIRDTGIGIPKDRQKDIFERFIQADIEDKMARQGAGLGLAISRAYVEMLEGKIWVESEPNCGSTFYFTIPYSRTREKPME